MKNEMDKGRLRGARSELTWKGVLVGTTMVLKWLR